MATEVVFRFLRAHLYLDVVLMAAFLVLLKPFVTGMAFHEWLGLAIGAAARHPRRAALALDCGHHHEVVR